MPLSQLTALTMHPGDSVTIEVKDESNAPYPIPAGTILQSSVLNALQEKVCDLVAIVEDFALGRVKISLPDSPTVRSHYNRPTRFDLLLWLPAGLRKYYPLSPFTISINGLAQPSSGPDYQISSSIVLNKTWTSSTGEEMMLRVDTLTDGTQRTRFIPAATAGSDLPVPTTMQAKDEIWVNQNGDRILNEVVEQVNGNENFVLTEVT